MDVKITQNQEPEWVCREGSSLREEPESLTLSPIRATWSFFSDVKVQDLKVT